MDFDPFPPRRSVKVLWPDGPRWVPEDTINGWAYDSWYDSADWYKCNKCGQNIEFENPDCQHDADCTPMYAGEYIPEPRSLEEAMDWLSDTGEVTFDKNPLDNSTMEDDLEKQNINMSPKD